MFDLNGINKSFGDCRALNGVNLRLGKGFVYTLKVKNGLGINLISCLRTPTIGIVHFKEKKIAIFTSYRVNRMGIGQKIQNR